MGSMNFALFPLLDKMKEFKFPWEKQYLEFSEDSIFSNTFKSLRVFLNTFDENETKPELEVYDAGMINNTAFLIERGILKTPIYIQFVLGILGGMAATIENLVFLYDSACRQIGEKNFVWSVCAAGKNQMPMCTHGLLMGGNARVGMEDALSVEKGVAGQEQRRPGHQDHPHRQGVRHRARHAGRSPKDPGPEEDSRRSGISYSTNLLIRLAPLA